MARMLFPESGRDNFEPLDLPKSLLANATPEDVELCDNRQVLMNALQIEDQYRRSDVSR